MRSDATIRAKISHYKESLHQWREPHGLLVSTEPDVGERASIRERLRVSIAVLEWVLEEDEPEVKP